eukprot:4509157-Amphidinium_carterae.1
MNARDGTSGQTFVEASVVPTGGVACSAHLRSLCLQTPSGRQGELVFHVPSYPGGSIELRKWTVWTTWGIGSQCKSESPRVQDRKGQEEVKQVTSLSCRRWRLIVKLASLWTGCSLGTASSSCTRIKHLVVDDTVGLECYVQAEVHQRTKTSNVVNIKKAFHPLTALGPLGVGGSNGFWFNDWIGVRDFLDLATDGLLGMMPAPVVGAAIMKMKL